MREYRELNALPAEAFLNPENFRTSYDTIPSNVERYSKEQYQEGLKVSRNAEYVYISANGTWGAATKGGGSLTAYEGIGYHACTADLLRGFLDGPAPLRVYRDGKEMKEIKGRTE